MLINGHFILVTYRYALIKLLKNILYRRVLWLILAQWSIRIRICIKDALKGPLWIHHKSLVPAMQQRAKDDN
jgi:hypothetical protein